MLHWYFKVTINFEKNEKTIKIQLLWDGGSI